MVRTVTLPWHLLKSLVLVIPRLLLIAAIMLLVAFLGAVSLRIATIHAEASIFGFRLSLILLAGQPVSLSGLVLAGGIAIGWILLCFGPYSHAGRVGSGAIHGVQATAVLEEYFPQSYDTHSQVMDAEDQHVSELTDRDESHEVGPPPVNTRGSDRRWTLWLTWLTLTLAALSVLVAHMNTGINWWPVILL